MDAREVERLRLLKYGFEPEQESALEAAFRKKEYDPLEKKSIYKKIQEMQQPVETDVPVYLKQES